MIKQTKRNTEEEEEEEERTLSWLVNFCNAGATYQYSYTHWSLYLSSVVHFSFMCDHA